MKFFRKKTVILITALITVFLLSGLAVNGKYKITFLESALSNLLSPFQHTLFRITESFEKAASFSQEITRVYHYNQFLKEENQKLRQGILDANELLAENMRLRTLLEYKRTNHNFDLITAQVIGRDPGTWTNIITVNRGYNDGISKNMVAVNQQGLVGTIVSVYANSSRIQLIIDPRSAIGVLVQRPQSRVAAIMEGNSATPLNPRMVNLAIDADILVNDKIVTSGFGGIYPKGLLVGEVAEIIKDDIGFLKYAVLNMAVDFNKLEDVFIIKKTLETAPPPTNAPEAKGAGQK